MKQIKTGIQVLFYMLVGGIHSLWFASSFMNTGYEFFDCFPAFFPAAVPWLCTVLSLPPPPLSLSLPPTPCLSLPPPPLISLPFFLPPFSFPPSLPPPRPPSFPTSLLPSLPPLGLVILSHVHTSKHTQTDIHVRMYHRHVSGRFCRLVNNTLTNDIMNNSTW